MTSIDTNSDLFIVMRQLQEKSLLTYPTVFMRNIVEMTAEQRMRLLQRNNHLTCPRAKTKLPMTHILGDNNENSNILPCSNSG
jgi:hypothetical protein